MYEGLETGLCSSSGGHIDGTRYRDAVCEAFMGKLAHQLLTYLIKYKENNPCTLNATSIEINFFLNFLLKAEALVQ